jgi:hypothetical protein
MTPIGANMVDPPRSAVSTNALTAACVKLALPPTDGGVCMEHCQRFVLRRRLLEFLGHQGIKPEKAVFQSNEEQK